MKKNSITKKLTLTNVLIVVLSLLIFFTIVLVIANGNALNDIQSQLIIENRGNDHFVRKQSHSATGSIQSADRQHQSHLY